MPPRTSLQISTAAVVRLTKEEASYRKEQVHEEKRLARLTEEGADEYEVRQQKKAVEETAAMIPAVRQKLEEAIQKLKNELEGAPKNETVEAKENAVAAIAAGKAVFES